MKKNNLLILATLLTVTGCKQVTPIDSFNNIPISDTLDASTITVRDTYSNKWGEDKIPEQWKDYGCGDPFVYRWNGRYYLYVSTKNGQKGVRCWVSDDLQTFTPVDNGTNDVGYCSNDACTVTAYAPEVTYFNGYFYMCESQAGSGHYILRSDRPEGPFTPITGNFGESIDGSFFIDDDEQIYFLRASNSGIRMAKLDETNNMALAEGQKKLDNTEIGGWTEGPYLMKKNGVYYLTYTGNNVLSAGYRVGYSYHIDGYEEVFSRSAFTQAETILLNTDEDYNGLGHSSSVMGPDMDSTYIAYHNLNSTGGPNRSFNLSRLFFSGTSMYATNVELNNNFVTNLPAFYTYNDEFVTDGDFKLSNTSSNDIFTAEFNFIGSNTKCVFSYVDASNYNYVTVTNNNEIELYKVENGKESKVTSTRLNKSYDYSRLHTLRVAYKDSLVDVYFDNMCKIDDFKVTFKGGKVGYNNVNLDNIEYTAYSNFAMGSSDQEEVKQEKALAANYSLDYSYLSTSKIVPQKENDNDEFNGKAGSYDLLLNRKGDRVTYPYYFNESSLYGFNMTLDKKYCGKTIILMIDEEKYKVKIPEISSINSQYVKVLLTEVKVEKGAHYVSFECVDEVAFHSFDTFVSSEVTPVFENALDSYLGEGVTYVNSWKLLDGGHYALSGNRQCLYLGKPTLSNYTVECDVKLVGETSSNTTGFIVRAQNPAFSNYDSFTSIQGYYIGFNNSKFTISKCDYNNSIIDIAAAAGQIESNTFYHIKIVVNNNNITATFNDTYTVTYSDDIGFTCGYFGLYTNGAASVFKNVKIY